MGEFRQEELKRCRDAVVVSARVVTATVLRLTGLGRLIG